MRIFFWYGTFNLNITGNSLIENLEGTSAI